MNRSIKGLLLSLLFNIPAVALINIILNLKMNLIDVIAWAIVTSLIGIGLAHGIPYLIKAAKEHEA